MYAELRIDSPSPTPGFFLRVSGVRSVVDAASRVLRHANLHTTSEHYSDSTARVSLGIGRLLACGGSTERRLLLLSSNGQRIRNERQV